jgi:hypothetical protein
MYSCSLVLLIALCVLLGTSRACSVDDGSLVTVGGDTDVCLMLSPLEWGAKLPAGAPEARFLSIKAKLKADEFSSVLVSEAWTAPSYDNDTALVNLNITATAAGRGLGVSLQSMGIPSYQKSYRRVDSAALNLVPTPHYDVSTVTFPILMAVIRVDEGKVVGITWDDTCDWCDAGRCAPNTYSYDGVLKMGVGANACYVPDAECVVPGTEAVLSRNGPTDKATQVKAQDLCQLKVYVTWTGTDSEGFHFLSAASRFSRLTETQMKYVVHDEEL